MVKKPTRRKRSTKRAPRLRTQLEKLDAADALGIDGPLGLLIRAARDSTALRERGHKKRGKGRVTR